MNTLTVNPTTENIAAAAALLRSGELVAMPTETVYGLAADAFNDDALAKIFAAKERPLFDPLIVHIAPPKAPSEPITVYLSRLGVVDVSTLSASTIARIESLAQAFWPGPLTLVLPRGPRIPDLCTAGLPHVGVRMPLHPVAQALISAAGVPLAAPSANRFGRISPTTAAHVATELEGRIAMILDGGPCSVGIESTVLAVTDQGATILRPGGVALSDLTRVLGLAPHLSSSTANSGAAQAAPGMLMSHYAPRKSMSLLPASLSQTLKENPDYFKKAGAKRVGLLVLTAPSAQVVRELVAKNPELRFHIEVLSQKGIEDAARGLFARMRSLDESDAEVLFAEPLSEELASVGLGHAIADRLRRATAK